MVDVKPWAKLTAVNWWNVAAGSFLAIIALGYAWSFTNRDVLRTSSANGEVTAAGTIAAAMTNSDAPTASYLTNAALDALTARMLASQLGKSGRLRASFQTSGGVTVDSLPAGAQVRYAEGADTVATPGHAGVWKVLIAMGQALKPISDFSVIRMLPFEAKVGGRIGTYRIGSWPAEHGAAGPRKAPADRYANPNGFIEVTPQNMNTYVSEHFKLGDFLTHDQQNVWPKYLVLSPRLVDKLELVLKDLEDHGINTKGVHIMSGFRTPQYNAGGGETAGRADLSRHMYGDASDIFIDNDGNGVMDDLNHDGKIDINDSRVILEAEERVERAYPELVGGGGLYRAASGHGPFIHIDTRGYRGE
jgi:hypothetical protein